MHLHRYKFEGLSDAGNSDFLRLQGRCLPEAAVPGDVVSPYIRIHEVEKGDRR